MSETVENSNSIVKIITLLLLIVFALSITTIVIYNYRLLTQQAIRLPTQSPFILDIKPQTTARNFVNTLYTLKLVRSKFTLLALIRWRGDTNHLQAGVYQVKAGETIIDLLNRVVKGDVLIESFRIPEGGTLADLHPLLRNAPYLHMDTKTAIFDLFAQGHLSAEGLFLADTYYYRAGSDAFVLLKRANQALRDYLELVWKNRSPHVPYKNSYELLIAASIVEKEAAVPQERQLIAGVIVNRLKMKMPLQMDPTVLYAHSLIMPSQQNPTTLTHQSLSIKSPYNTYVHRGLPPTPIATVSKQALQAVAQPDETDYLYFVAKGDGTHQFSKTYQEQRKAINQYRLRMKTQ